MTFWKYNTSLLFCLLVQMAIGQFSELSTDPIGNVYRWNNHRIEKTEVNNSIKFQNDFLSFGDIQNFDLTNPFKPFLFFENSQTIVILDNTLSKQGELDLTQFNLGWITQVCGSKWSGYWLWNNMTKTLIKINPNGEPILQIPNLSQSYIHSSWEIRWMAKNSNQLFMRDGEHFFVFDLLGGLSKTLPFAYSPTWIVEGKAIQYRDQRIEEIYPTIQTLGTTVKQPIYIDDNGLYFSPDSSDFLPWSRLSP